MTADPVSLTELEAAARFGASLGSVVWPAPEMLALCEALRIQNEALEWYHHNYAGFTAADALNAVAGLVDLTPGEKP